MCLSRQSLEAQRCSTLINLMGKLTWVQFMRRAQAFMTSGSERLSHVLPRVPAYASYSVENDSASIAVPFGDAAHAQMVESRSRFPHSHNFDVPVASLQHAALSCNIVPACADSGIPGSIP